MARRQRVRKRRRMAAAMGLGFMRRGVGGCRRCG